MEPVCLSRRFHVSLQLFLQRLHQTGNSDHHRYSFLLDGVNDFAGIQRVLEEHCCRQHLRQKDSQELSEHVTQGQQVQKPQRMKDAFILQVLANLPLQRFQVGENVAMSDDHASRLGGGSGSEYDLHDVIPCHT